ncbi:MAG: GTPase domain-containing protein, partial [Phycisphaerae bacterium]|nr:GTPase domain-containing protein [Phycisphaerae bacterium]
MADEFTDISARTREWFEGAHEAGWLDAAEFERFTTLEHATPADLFTDQEARPLVVAFFGGTGVGKSSLLNRLAGSQIARIGVERPTSREITLYVHRDVKLADFPQALPLESVRVERHDNEARRDFLWIDAPDIDSTEAANRECALAWLPHIDLLVYVVSPERYRDDTGWRVLLERGQRHGWMFIMNHWDDGDRTQRDDFTRMLRSAGFDNPLVLCTCCVDRGGVQDEFSRVEAVLQDLLAAHGVRELTRLGHRARLQELRQVLLDARQRLGDEEGWDNVAAAAKLHWGQTVDTVSDGLQWSMQSVAARLATREDGMLATLRQTAGALRGERPAQPEQPGPDVGELSYLTESLWEQWADRKIADGIAAIENTTQKHGIGVRPVRERLEEVIRGARTEVMTALQDELRGALGDPGTAFQHAARRIT